MASVRGLAVRRCARPTAGPAARGALAAADRRLAAVMIDRRLLERWPGLPRHPEALVALASPDPDIPPATLLESVLLNRIAPRDLAATIDGLLTAGEWSVARDAIEVYADDDDASAMLDDVATEQVRWLTALRIRLVNLRARA